MHKVHDGYKHNMLCPSTVHVFKRNDINTRFLTDLLTEIIRSENIREVWHTKTKDNSWKQKITEKIDIRYDVYVSTGTTTTVIIIETTITNNML